MKNLLFMTFMLIGLVFIVIGVILKRAAYGKESTHVGVRNRIDGSVFLCMGMVIIMISGIYYAYEYGLHHALSRN